MQRKLVITLDEQVYDGLCKAVGREQISEFIESLVRPHVIKISPADLEAGYRQMAADEERETEANEWMEANLGHPRDEAG